MCQRYFLREACAQVLVALPTERMKMSLSIVLTLSSD